MDHSRKLSFIILAACLCVIAIGVAFLVMKKPNEPFLINVQNGETIICDYIGEDENITIPYTVGGKDVTGIKAETFKDKTDIKSVMIRNNVTTVGAKAFDGWTNGQTIMIEAETNMDGWDADWNAGCAATIMDEVTITRE